MSKDLRAQWKASPGPGGPPRLGGMVGAPNPPKPVIAFKGRCFLRHAAAITNVVVAWIYCSRFE